MPGGNAKNSYSPVVLVCISRWNAWLALSSDTLASPTLALVLSETVPRTEVVPVCVQAQLTDSRSMTKEIERLRFIEDHPINYPFRTPLLKTDQTQQRGACK